MADESSTDDTALPWAVLQALHDMNLSNARPAVDDTAAGFASHYGNTASSSGQPIQSQLDRTLTHRPTQAATLLNILTVGDPHQPLRSRYKPLPNRPSNFSLDRPPTIPAHRMTVPSTPTTGLPPTPDRSSLSHPLPNRPRWSAGIKASQHLTPKKPKLPRSPSSTKFTRVASGSSSRSATQFYTQDRTTSPLPMDIGTAFRSPTSLSDATSNAQILSHHVRTCLTSAELSEDGHTPFSESAMFLSIAAMSNFLRSESADQREELRTIVDESDLPSMQFAFAEALKATASDQQSSISTG